MRIEPTFRKIWLTLVKNHVDELSKLIELRMM